MNKMIQLIGLDHQKNSCKYIGPNTFINNDKNVLWDNENFFAMIKS